MDFLKMTRNARLVLSNLVELPDESVVTKTNLQIVFPNRWIEKGLAEIGTECYVFGFFAIVLDETYYTVCSAIAMMPVSPNSTQVIKIDGVDYSVFDFTKGNIIFPSLRVVKKDTLAYRAYAEFISRGKTPVYMGYLDKGDIFSTAKRYADANVGKNSAVSRIISSAISRDKDDKTIPYRLTIKDKNYLITNPEATVPLQSVLFAPDNTTNKLLGSYWDPGLVSALAYPSDRTERVEDALRY